MDPAFLSRLYKIEYDYLPQEIQGSPGNADAVSKSELFHLILSSLMTRTGDLEVPEHSVEQLWNLAKAARVTQDVFSGRQVNQAFYYQEGGTRATPYRLREGVLSIRALTKVLHQWQSEGYRYELDHYVWKEFIEQSTSPADRAYLYQLFKDRFGFFNGSGWEQSPNYGRSGALGSFSVTSPQNPSLQPAFYSARDVVSFAFGSPPERTSWPVRN
ncbi:MAG: hypothetical protein WBK28_03575 [Minisyncoccia bacterium]